jgi:biopolymer transport protein ExbD
MAGGGGGSDGDCGFQIAPMIDLILVLMVFFMSTVALKQVENELPIALPGKALGDTPPSKVDLNVTIEADGSISLNGEAVADQADKELPTLRARLKEQVDLFDDKIPVVIIPQSDVKHGRVIDVLNACSAANIRNISFGG